LTRAQPLGYLPFAGDIVTPKCGVEDGGKFSERLPYLTLNSCFGARPVLAAATRFDDDASRADHFQRHGRDFGAKDALEYETLARKFLNGPLRATMQQCVRRGNGDLIRFDAVTQAFAVMR